MKRVCESCGCVENASRLVRLAPGTRRLLCARCRLQARRLNREVRAAAAARSTRRKEAPMRTAMLAATAALSVMLMAEYAMAVPDDDGGGVADPTRDGNAPGNGGQRNTYDVNTEAGWRALFGDMLLDAITPDAPSNPEREGRSSDRNGDGRRDQHDGFKND
jgi:hypothetical protein